MENTQLEHTPDRVLADARELRAVSLAAEAALLEQAARWADLHPVRDPHLVATFHLRGYDTGMRLTAAGLPDVSAACVAELAAAVGLSTSAGERLIAHALELRHRLPRTWTLVQAGDVPAWQARQVADHTLTLTPAAAQFVDAQVAAMIGRVSAPQLERLIRTALIRHMPAEAERRRLEAADARDVQIRHDTTGARQGCSEIWGSLDLPDALALDAAVTDGARVLGELGSTDRLGARRARALGDLARCQPGLDLTTHEPTADEPTGDRPVLAGSHRNAPPGRVGTVEPIVLYLHLSTEALCTGIEDGSGQVENTRCPVTTAQVRDWCGRPTTRISVRPVIDLTQNTTADSREVPDWMRQRIALRDRTCVFPYCSRPARLYPSRRALQDGRVDWRVDVDHILAHGDGGATSTDNGAPLCRIHHLLKTFAGWRYRVTGIRSYEWTSPHRLRYLRTPDGATHDLGPLRRGRAGAPTISGRHGTSDPVDDRGGSAHRSARRASARSASDAGPRALGPPGRHPGPLPCERQLVPVGGEPPGADDPPPF